MITTHAINTIQHKFSGKTEIIIQSIISTSILFYECTVSSSFLDFSWAHFSFLLVWVFAGAATSPLLTADSGMNTMIEGGHDKKLTAKLQKVQGMAMGASASEVLLRDCFNSTRSIAERLRLGPTTKVRFFLLIYDTRVRVIITRVISSVLLSYYCTTVVPRLVLLVGT